MPNATADGMKVCTACKAVKPIADYNLDRSRPDGLSSRCRPCQRESVRKANQLHPERRRERHRKARQRNQRKRRARELVHGAIKRGELVRPESCGKCGATGEIHAHHSDYDNPLEVEWVCDSCHRLLHGQQARDMPVKIVQVAKRALDAAVGGALDQAELEFYARTPLGALSATDLLSLAAERMGEEERRKLEERFAQAIPKYSFVGDGETWDEANEHQRGRRRELAQVVLAVLLPGGPE